MYWNLVLEPSEPDSDPKKHSGIPVPACTLAPSGIAKMVSSSFTVLELFQEKSSGKTARMTKP